MAFESVLKRFGYSKESRVMEGELETQDTYWKDAFPTEKDAAAAQAKGVIPTWIFNPAYGQPRYTRQRTIFNAIEIRKLATCSVVRSCVKRLQSDVMSTPYKVDGKLKTLIDNPNPNAEPFTSILGQVVQDVLELDAGVIEKAFGGRSRTLKELYARDGATFYKDIDKHGRLGMLRDVFITEHEVKYAEAEGRRQKGVRRLKIAYWQYGQGMSEGPIPFTAKEIVYITQHPRTDSPYGQSNVYGVHMEIANLMQGVMSRELILRKSRIPHGILGFEGMTGTEWDKFREYVDRDVMGREHKVIIVGRKPFWLPFQFTDRDMQFLETQQWFTNLIINVFGLTRVVLGLETELKGEAQTQRQLYTQKGLWPLLMLMEHHINAGIGGAKGTEGEFHFKLHDPIAEMKRLEMDEVAIKNGLKTINDIRLRDGFDPLPWGELNTAALANLAQSFFYGAINIQQFQLMSGIPSLGKAREVLKSLGEMADEEQTNEFFKRVYEEWRKTK